MGNVRVTHSDIKMPTGSGSQPFMVDLLSKSEYYPFGMEITGLSWNTGNNRYGYGGTHEMDNEVKGGVGNHLSFGDFGYDTRTARRQNIDPMFAAYPHLSGYATFNNNPIYYNDPTGYEPNEGAVVYADKYVKPKAGGDKDLGTNILDGTKNSLIVLGGIVNSIVSNSFTYSDKNIINIDNFKVSDETKHYFKVGEEGGHKLTIAIAAAETALGIFAEATGTFLLPFTGGGSGLVIGEGFVLNAHGVFASTNAIIKLQNMNSVGNTSGGGSGKNFEFPKANQLAKYFNVDIKKFERVIKKEILKDAKEFLKKLGSKNPDIGFSKDGNIVLKDPRNGKTIETNLKLSNYRE